MGKRKTTRLIEKIGEENRKRLVSRAAIRASGRIQRCALFLVDRGEDSQWAAEAHMRASLLSATGGFGANVGSLISELSYVVVHGKEDPELAAWKAEVEA